MSHEREGERRGGEGKGGEKQEGDPGHKDEKQSLGWFLWGNPQLGSQEPFTPSTHKSPLSHKTSLQQGNSLPQERSLWARLENQLGKC